MSSRMIIAGTHTTYLPQIIGRTWDRRLEKFPSRPSAEVRWNTNTPWLSSVHLFIKLQLDYQCARALQRLSLAGQRNILAFMQHSQSDPSLSGALRSLESLSVTCIDDFNPASNLELLEHFLRLLDGSKIRELRVQDERPRKIPFLFWSTCKD